MLHSSATYIQNMNITRSLLMIKSVIFFTPACSIYLSGIIMSRTAFSWTCHPKRKELKAHSVTHRMKPFGPPGYFHR